MRACVRIRSPGDRAEPLLFTRLTLSVLLAFLSAYAPERAVRRWRDEKKPSFERSECMMR
eukprot:3164813-Pleurochrysis_carterae.AAC.1